MAMLSASCGSDQAEILAHLAPLDSDKVISYTLDID
jgi:hypothetical protein